MQNDQSTTDESHLVLAAVDDNPADLRLLRHYLEVPGAYGSVELLTFDAPCAAIEGLRYRAVDGLLIDYQMSVVSGFDFLSRARAAGINAPAILLTGNGDEELAVSALHAGFADYLPKNALSEQSLRRSVGNAIEKHRLASSAAAYKAELEGTVRQLESSNREISNFYHTLAHELKTPLTAVREFVSIVADGLQGPLTPDQHDTLSSAVRSCDQLHRCIDDLFDVSRIETGKFDVCKKPDRLDEIVEQGVARFTSQAKEKGIDLIVNVASGGGELPLDRDRILQVMSNLIGNALKFTGRNGRVVVNYSPEGNYERVSVADTGVGISPEELDHVFDRLYQAEGNATISGGMGLGLHLCQELIQLHGGTLKVTSEKGKGSTFTFLLPKADAERADDRVDSDQAA